MKIIKYTLILKARVIVFYLLILFRVEKRVRKPCSFVGLFVFGWLVG